MQHGKTMKQPKPADLKENTKTKYEDSLFYQINSSAKCFDLLFEQIFKELDLGISGTEHLVLSIILETKDCCQRDLARIILKDRANTGKLAKKLQEKGLIKIEHKTKNNKLVKILTITKKGEKIHDTAMEKIRPMIDEIKKEVCENKINNLIKELVSFREIVKKAVKLNI